MKLVACSLWVVLGACGQGGGSSMGPNAGPDAQAAADANGGSHDASAGHDGPVGSDGGVGIHEANCVDGIDDDGDGKIDCVDPDCGQTSTCESSTAADPNRVTLGHECQGPLADPTMLARFIPSGAGAATFDYLEAFHRDRDCNPTTGCTPWRLYANEIEEVWYTLRVDTAGAGHVSERAFNHTQVLRDAPVTASELVVQLGVPTSSGLSLQPTTVRLTNPAPDQLCVSFTQSSTTMNGATTRDSSHIATITLPLVTPSAPAPFAPLHCTQGPATNAVVAGWFAPGGTSLFFHSQQNQRGQKLCHPLTGCVAAQSGMSSRFSSPSEIDVGAGGLEVRVGAGYPALAAGAFDYAGTDSYGIPWTMHGTTHADRCIETLSGAEYWDPWYYTTVTLSESNTTTF